MIEYSCQRKPSADAVCELFVSSGIRRPTKDVQRIQSMLDGANILYCAWENDLLVGLARSLTDFCYCCYLSDLAVRSEYQKQGVGKSLVRLTKELIGDSVLLLLLSAPGAVEYYPKIGMEKHPNAFIIKRTE